METINITVDNHFGEYVHGYLYYNTSNNDDNYWILPSDDNKEICFTIATSFPGQNMARKDNNYIDINNVHIQCATSQCMYIYIKSVCFVYV